MQSFVVTSNINKSLQLVVTPNINLHLQCWKCTTNYRHNHMLTNHLSHLHFNLKQNHNLWCHLAWNKDLVKVIVMACGHQTRSEYSHYIVALDYSRGVFVSLMQIKSTLSSIFWYNWMCQTRRVKLFADWLTWQCVMWIFSSSLNCSICHLNCHLCM